ncbi:MAG: VCBS repeat-containing protein [Gemmataceae bacterium]|nr:VCBS repeat-containing protein [Gemmataceae bacterium]
MSLGAVVQQSTHIMTMRVEKVDKEKNLIIYRKERDLKGKHPTDIIKHNIGRGGFNPREWQYIMEWAEPGKLAVFCHNGGASETCINNYWYQAYAGGDWWNMSHGEPFLLRSFAGKPEKLAAAIDDMLAGKEVIVTCMVDGNKNDLHLRQARIQRMKASLKLQDYNPKRDFVGWGGEDYRRLIGMPGFTRLATLGRFDPEAQAISSVDFDGDGQLDLCLVGAGRVALLHNGGDSFNDVSLPGVSGARAAVWADYNADGKPDLLLATPTGPRLFSNQGGGTFRDDSHLLPREPGYNLTAAAWLDYDADGKPDVLLGNGYHGLRLYRNLGRAEPAAEPIRLGRWFLNGPWDNTDGKGFDRVYPPEEGVDLAKVYPGKNNEPAAWREAKFVDGQVNSLLNILKPEFNRWTAVYLYREITCAAPMELPVSLGSDDTLTVWLNGQKLLAENVYRGVGPDQSRLTLKLRAGKNALLLKICQGDGDWGFYFAADVKQSPVVSWRFADVSEQVGLGLEGSGGLVKGDSLSVADVNGDGRPDVLYGAGQGLLLVNTPRGFVAAKDSGIVYRPGKVGPVFGDFNHDGLPDLLVPQRGSVKLFRNDGQGRFTDVTARAGDLAQALDGAVAAAWGDIDNDGLLDVVIGCLSSPNRVFRNRGDGTFEDRTDALGLGQRSYATAALLLVDLNADGALDFVFNNEGQEAMVLLANAELARQRTPLTLHKLEIGSRVRVLNAAGQTVRVQDVSGGDGRGGQSPLLVRFALPPGSYRLEVRSSGGQVRSKEVTLGSTPTQVTLD